MCAWECQSGVSRFAVAGASLSAVRLPGWVTVVILTPLSRELFSNRAREHITKWVIRLGDGLGSLSMADAMPEIETTLQLRRESTAEQVASALRELILSARFMPGTHLREGPLADQLGVSRNTVREAMQILVSEGLVTREIHRGAYVARLTV